MDNKVLVDNINILQRNLVNLKDTIVRSEISKGRKKFIDVYFEVISEYIGKSLDILDSDKYKEVLINLED